MGRISCVSYHRDLSSNLSPRDSRVYSTMEKSMRRRNGF